VAPRLAENAAQRLLRRLGPFNPPIDLHEICRRLGLPIAHERLGRDVSAMLLRNGERGVIAVNSSHPLVRQRFSIAHEIGHFLLHKGVYIDKVTRVNQRVTRATIGIDPDEVQANAFAAELLMPFQLVLREFTTAVRDGHGEAVLIKRLAARFQVSEQAMEIRLKVLGALAPF
jgi:Zn-dependent peptidase ImmA (M78 family)